MSPPIPCSQGDQAEVREHEEEGWADVDGERSDCWVKKGRDLTTGWPPSVPPAFFNVYCCQKIYEHMYRTLTRGDYGVWGLGEGSSLQNSTFCLQTSRLLYSKHE